MKHFMWVLLSLSLYSCCQNLQHQMLSFQGKSTILSNGMIVSQTIGQQSTIGNHSNGINENQGFQQNHLAKYLNCNVANHITTTNYPNSIIKTVNFQF